MGRSSFRFGRGALRVFVAAPSGENDRLAFGARYENTTMEAGSLMRRAAVSMMRKWWLKSTSSA